MRRSAACLIGALLWAAFGCSASTQDGTPSAADTQPHTSNVVPNGADTLKAWTELGAGLDKQRRWRDQVFFGNPHNLDSRLRNDSFEFVGNRGVDPEVKRLAIILRKWNDEESTLALKVAELALHYDPAIHQTTPTGLRARLGFSFFDNSAKLQRIIVPERAPSLETDRERLSIEGVRRADQRATVEIGAEVLARRVVEHRQKLVRLVSDAKQIRTQMEEKHRVKLPELRVEDAALPPTAK